MGLGRICVYLELTMVCDVQVIVLYSFSKGIIVKQMT